MKEQEISQLDAYFRTADRDLHKKGLYYQETQKGFFLPASLSLVSLCLDTLIQEGYISTDERVLEAGSGDGRVVALASYVYGFDTVGVEHDKKLARYSKRFLKESPFDFDNYEIIQGDFLRDKTYENAGYRFSDFDIVFNYENNLDRLASKIRDDSGDTRFILISKKIPEGLEGLALQYHLHLQDYGIAHDFAAKQMYMSRMQMGLYEKAD